MDAPATSAERLALLVACRLEALLDAGFPGTEAEQLAVDLNVDVEEALRLVGLGCAPETAARILP
jgi:hypothetical protein